MSTQVSRRLFTTKEYHQILEAGILSEDDRVELIAGEIVKIAPIGSRHAACVNRLNRLLSQRVGEHGLVSIQNPIHLSEHSEPQPDVVLLRPRADFYTHAHPQPQDILLVVEVAETSVEYGREVKSSYMPGQVLWKPGSWISAWSMGKPIGILPRKGIGR